ncbi:MAG: DUF58 domain-containing protein [Oscillospiraceae bacterium]
MIFFVVFIVVLALVLQHYYMQKGIDGLNEDHYASLSLAEPDEVFELVVRFTNRSRMFIPFIRFREYLADGITAADENENVHNGPQGNQYVEGTTWLKPRQRLERRIPVRAAGRGRYLLRELSVSGGDFLGLSENSRTYNKIIEVVVYPKESPAVDTDKVFGGFLGELSVNRFIFEDPVLTLGFREYTGREPLKMISWSQSARVGSLMVKKFDYTLEPTVSVVVNVESSLNSSGELIEKCYSMARTVCRGLEDRGIKYDFRMNSSLIGGLTSTCYIDEGMGNRHFQAILESLGRATYGAVFSSDMLIERTMRNAGAGHGVIFITPGGDAALEGSAKRIAERFGCTMLTLTAEGGASC